jgi:hypothetical protein
MGFTAKKYRVSVIFCHKQYFFNKIEGKHLWIYSQNLYTEPLCITDLEYGLHGEEIQDFNQFLPQSDVFSVKSKDNTFGF